MLFSATKSSLQAPFYHSVRDKFRIWYHISRMFQNRLIDIAEQVRHNIVKTGWARSQTSIHPLPPRKQCNFFQFTTSQLIFHSYFPNKLQPLTFSLTLKYLWVLQFCGLSFLPFLKNWVGKCPTCPTSSSTAPALLRKMVDRELLSLLWKLCTFEIHATQIAQIIIVGSI